MTGRAIILRGDAAHLPLPDASVHAVVCDPPYGLAELPAPVIAKALGVWLAGDRIHVPDGRGFMGREWDRFVPPPAAWDECLRVLKPGGHLLAFAGSRTADLMGLSIRLAGFEIRDSIPWLYGSGYPKSLDVGKAIDKIAGRGSMPVSAIKERLRVAFEASGMTQQAVNEACGFRASGYLRMAADGERRDPWANVLPSAEKWAVMKNVLGCGSELDDLFKAAEREVVGRARGKGTRATIGPVGVGPGDYNVTRAATSDAERWDGWGTALKPAHEPIIMGRKPLVGAVAVNVLTHGTGAINVAGCRIDDEPESDDPVGHWPPNVLLSEETDAEVERQHGARIFPVFHYEAKADASERPKLPDGTAWPTVKPVALMRWLVRLVTPPGGTVLDPFCGTGATGEAAIIEGFEAILLDRDPQAIALTQARLSKPMQPLMFALEPTADVTRAAASTSTQDSLFSFGEAS